MEEIIYKIEVEDAGASKAAQNIANSLNKVDDTVNKSKGSLSGFTGELGKAVPAVGQLTTAFKAMIATPVGLVMAAIAAAIGVITAAIKKSEPALDLIENAFNAIGTIANVLIDNLKNIGMILINLATGNFPAAIQGIKNLTSEIKNAVVASQQLLDLERDLEDAMFNFRLATADEENQLKALVIASKNRNLSLDEQAKKLNEVLEREKELVAGREDLARREAVIGIKKIALDKNVRQSDDETFEQFVKNLVNSGKFSKEENEKIVSLYEKQKSAASDSLSFQEKVSNMQDAIAEKRAAANQKQIEDADALAKYIQGIIDGLTSSQMAAEQQAKAAQDERLSGLRESSNEEVKIVTDATLAIQNARESLNKKVIQSDQAAAKVKQGISEGNIATIGREAGFIAAKTREGSALNRAAQSTKIIIDTRAAAMGSYAALAEIPFIGPVLAAIAAGVAIAYGAQQLAAVNAAPGFARGGLTGKRITSNDGTPISRSNGDNILATVKTGEVILNERHQKLLGGDSTFARIGVPGFANSGFVSAGPETTTISRQINDNRILLGITDAIRNMPRQVAIIEEIEALNQQRVEIREQATI
jgi:hypothetical protein